MLSYLRLNKKNFSFFIILILFLILPLIGNIKLFFIKGVIGFEGDWTFPIYAKQVQDWASKEFYAWNPTTDFGCESGSPGFILKVFMAVLSYFGLDGNFLSKFICLFIPFLSGLSMYFLCQRLKLDKFPSLVAGIFYMFTPEIFNRISAGLFFIGLTYALMPLALSLFMQALEQNFSFKKILLAGLVLATVLSNESALVLILFIFIFFNIICFIYERKSKIRLLLFNILILFVVCLIHSHWIVPMLSNIYWSSSGRIITYLGNFPIKYHTHSINFIHAIRLLGGHLPYNKLFEDNFFWIIFIRLLPAFITFLAYFQYLAEKNVFIFAHLAFLGILITSLPNQIWVWIINKIPILWIFRDNTKFYLFICIGYGVVIGSYLDNFINKYNKYIYRDRMNRFLFIILIGFIIFIYAWPFFTGNFGGYLHVYDYGEEYKELYHWLSNEPEDYRIFWLPAPYPTQFEETNFSGYDSFAFYAGKPVLYTGKYTGPGFLIFLIKNMYDCRTEYLDELLGISNVKYLIFDVGKRTTATDLQWVDMYFPYEKYTNDKILKTIKKQKNINLFKNFDSIKIFENKGFLPHIFGLSRISIVSGGLDTLVSLAYTEKYRPKDIGIVFSSQLSSGDWSLLDKMPNLLVIIQDNNYLGFVLDSIDKTYYLNPIDYYTSQTPDKGWALFFWFWHNWHYQTSLEHLIFTWIESVLDVPFSIDSEDEYAIFVKTYFGPQASKINIYLDSKEIKDIVTKTSNEQGFRWVKINEGIISKGKHFLSFKSETGENILAKIIIVPNKVFEEASLNISKFIQDKQIILLSELEKIELSPMWKSYDLGIEASQGFGVGTNSIYPFKYSLFIPKKGTYDMYLRVLSKKEDILTLELGEYKFNINIDTNDVFKWYKISSFNLDKGLVNLVFKKVGDDFLYLDQLMLVEHKEETEPNSLLFSSEKISPTKYQLLVHTTYPFYLFFSETYHPSWKILCEDGTKINGFLGYSFGNLFFVDKVGKLNLTLEFERQRYVDIGKKISLVSLFALSILLIMPSRIFKRKQNEG